MRRAIVDDETSSGEEDWDVEEERSLSQAQVQQGEVPEEHPVEDLPDDVFESGDRGERGYLYRPGEILVPASGDSDDVADDVLKGEGFEPDDEPWPDVVRYRSATDEDRGEYVVPDLVDRLRKRDGAHVYPNHVLMPQKHLIFGPAGPPIAAGGHRLGPRSSNVGSGVRVTVIDTGITDHQWFGRRFVNPPNEYEVGAVPGWTGHGTFVTSVVLRYAPAADVISLKAPGNGIAIDDLQLARMIVDFAPMTDIFNLSMGGFSADDHGVPVVERAILDAQQANPDLVFVAAAGNAATTRPFYPAAQGFPVVGVAACKDNGNLAWFSNRGPWITCRAPGERVLGAYVQPQAGPPPRHGPWTRWSGTSFAAPYVTGAIAAAWNGAGGGWAAVADVLAHVPYSYRVHAGVLASTPEHAADLP
jgi:subtilisin family serine protease